MPITRAPSLVAGVSTNPNTLTRSLVQSYSELAQGINFLAEVFSYGDLRPVSETDLASRWGWSTNTSIANLTGIKDSAMGLDGTSIYTYASDLNSTVSFLNKDPLFIIENVTADGLAFNGEKRPATIYESFLNMKTYVDTQVSTNLNPLLSLTSSLEAFLSAAGAGAANGTAVIVDNDEFSLSSWRFTEYGYNSVNYPALLNAYDTGILVEDDTFKVLSSNFELLGGPSGASFVYDTDGFVTDTADAVVSLKSNTDIILNPGVTFPISEVAASNPPAGHVKLYYSDEFSALRLRESNGTESPIGGGGGGHIEAVAGSTTWSLVMTTNSTTYLINGSVAYSLTLPAISDVQLGWEITIADSSDQAGTNPINVSTADGDAFVGYGATELTIDNNSGLVRLQVTSQGWLILYTK